jgi:hypothetical protein
MKMRNAWRNAAAAALWIGLVFPAQAEQKDLSGEYVMSGKGVGENDIAYVGTCTLKAIESLTRSPASTPTPGTLMSERASGLAISSRP